MEHGRLTAVALSAVYFRRRDGHARVEGRMRIAIDYTAAIAQRAGIGRYTRSLVAALADLVATEAPPGDTLTLYSSEPPTIERPFPRGAHIQPKVAGWGGHVAGNRAMTVLWHRLGIPLPVQTFTGPVDVLHAPDFALPPSLGARCIVTIHDLAFLTHPECALPSLVAYLASVVPRAVERADHVVAVSHTTADDLVRLLGVPRAKISVIALGVDPAFQPVRDPVMLTAVTEHYGLAPPFILAVGTLEPRKNYARLIAAFAQAHRTPGGPRMLAIAGGTGWLTEGIHRAIAESGVAESVRLLGYVPDGDLPALYSSANVVAVPSLYEGFGIPILEAMACGAPVLASTGGSLPEVAGDAAVLVAPTDVEAMTEGLLRLSRDTDARAELAARGQARARQFTWEACARAHLDLYHAFGSDKPLGVPFNSDATGDQPRAQSPLER